MLKSLTSVAAITLALGLNAGIALAANHGDMKGMHQNDAVQAEDQDVSGGSVTATKVTAPEKGWLVIHRTDAEMKPGPVLGYAPLEEGENMDVTAELTEAVESGDMLMLMVHTDATGMKPGEFEYTLGATEDGPIKADGKLVMSVITAE